MTEVHDSSVTLGTILAPESGERAFAKVRTNRGAPGADRISIDELAPVFGGSRDLGPVPDELKPQVEVDERRIRKT